MKNILFLLSITSLLVISCSDSPTQKPVEKEISEDNSYDSALANKVGADEYGMRTYVMAFLTKGPNRDISEEESDKLQRAHLENIGKLVDQGVLQLAGPFFGEGDLRGIYLFSVDSIEKAEKLVETDPAIKAGSLEMELHLWYGSAALMEIPRLHNKVSKTEI